MSEVVYSAQRSNFSKGRIYLNPRFFDGVLQPGATAVVVVGNWPSVVAAYEEAGIPVTEVGEGDKLPPPNDGGEDNVSAEVNSDNKRSVVKGKGKDVGEVKPRLKPGDNIEIPEKLNDLPYRDITALIAKIDPTADVSNKKDAIAWLEAYRVGKEPPGDDE